jgi:hypothetical protein
MNYQQFAMTPIQQQQPTPPKPRTGLGGLGVTPVSGALSGAITGGLLGFGIGYLAQKDLRVSALWGVGIGALLGLAAGAAD